MWFITVMEKIDCDNLGWPSFGNKRTWGFYSDRTDAVRALHYNVTNMHEGCYDFAVMEEYDEGISGYTGNCQWFEYDKERNGYFEIDKPYNVRNVGSFALG